MEEEREEGGITLGYIFRTIFSQKWLALALVIVITVAGTLGFYYVNGSKKEYVTTFSITLPDANETDSYYKYPDGNRFYYVNLTSSNILKSVKDSNPDFSDVDVNKIIKNGISIEEKIETIETEEKGVVLLRRSFELRISANSFKDINKALSFVTELVNYPVKLYYNMDINHNVYLNKNDFDNALTFERQINYIQSQINYLNSRYKSLTNIMDEEGNSIESKQHQFNAWVDRIDLSSILTEISANYYLKDYETSIADYRNQLVSLTDKRDDAQDKLTNVRDYITDNDIQSDDVAAVIADLESQLINLDRQITTINKYIDAYEGSGKEQHIVETQKFAQKIQNIYDELTGDEGFIAIFTDLSKSVYEKEAAVSFFGSNIVKIEGGWGFTTSFLISFVLAVIVAAIIAFIVGWSRQRKAVQALESKNEEPAGEIKVEANSTETVQSEENKKEDK